MTGRGALVTGAGRPEGIGQAICARLEERGARVFRHASEPEARVDVHADFLQPEAPERVVAAAADALGHVDVLVVNHAADSPYPLGALRADAIDRALAVNVRAPLLLVQSFFSRHDGRPGGRVVLLTSGQHRGPMTRELPYVAGKGALHQLTRTLAAAVAGKGITVNAVDPGATDTGWATPEIEADVLACEPFGRWGEPDDAARLIAFLCSDDGRWITGQVITSSGGGP